MTTVLLSGVGNLGGWALEFLARSPQVNRIVTLKRSVWSGPSLTTLAMLGSVFQGHVKHFEHHQADLADEEATARLLEVVRPDVIIHSATIQSPRRFMQAEMSPELRAKIRTATFGLWLPWHLLPAAQLMRAIRRAGINTKVINAAFPDVVNPALWRRFGDGPTGGAGNLEVCAARVLRYVMARTGKPPEEIEVRMVGSHALMVYGPQKVPHHFHLKVAGEEAAEECDLSEALTTWPERIDWGRTDVFSLFAASAVKNALALVGSTSTRTHVTSPGGLPGGYPAVITSDGIQLDLPEELAEKDAVAINESAARFDGIERLTEEGSVIYTPSARSAMLDLGYDCEAVVFEELPERCRELKQLFANLISGRETNARIRSQTA